MGHEKSGLGIDIASPSTISKKVGKAFSGKGLTVFVFLLVCLSAASGYLLGSQVSFSEVEGTIFTKSYPSLSSSEHRIKLKSVANTEEPEIMEKKNEKIPSVVSPDSDKRVIMAKLKKTEKQTAFVEKTEPAAGTKAKCVRYALAGGAYIFHGNLQKDREFAEMLDLPFHVQEIKKDINMTRLLVGTFPVEKEKVELKKLEAYTRDAFAIRHGRKVSIYAGSFYYPAYTHRWKNRFMEQGLNVEEVSAHVEMPLYASYIGDFETVKDAMLAVKRAESTGRKMPIIEIP